MEEGILLEALIQKFQAICEEHPFTEKMFIVDRYSIGQEIKQAYLDSERDIINLKVKKVLDLAIETVELLSDQPVNLLENLVGVQFTTHILMDLNAKKQLTYFNDIEVTPSFSYSIYESLLKMRLAGYTSETLNTRAFVSSEKASDFVLIMNSYEKLLSSNQVIDEPDLFRKAASLGTPQDHSVYILQSNLSLSQLEHDFLYKILPKKLFKLPLPSVKGVATPEYEDLRSIEWSEPTPLSYLYRSAKVSRKPDITVFKAKTEEVEIKQIFNQIKQSKRSLDDIVIFYTKSDPYVSTLFHLSEKYQIPITFGDGLSLLYSQPGRFISGLIKWYNDNYSVPVFIELVNEGLIELPDKAPSNSRISRYLREAKVGWDSSRYQTQLELYENEIQQKIAETKDEQRTEYYQKQLTEIRWVKTWFGTLFKKMPVIEANLNYHELLLSFSSLLKNHSKTSSLLDEQAKTAILETIDVLLPYADETLNTYDAFEKVKAFILTQNIHQSGPKPGHLHVCSYKKGIYNRRTHVFIVGLDNRSFPGTTGEDPLLLDEERKQLSELLPLLEKKGEDNLYSMLQLLSQTTGPVSFSFCDFSINDNRTVSPAHIVLQGYRMMTENPNADFKSLKNLPSYLTPPDSFEEKDFWNQQFLDHGTNIEIEPELLKSFKNLTYGEIAEVARKQPTLTEFDGFVHIDPEQYDPRVNKERVLSSGKLEKLATCPYMFFLDDILKLKPIDEMIFHSHEWLDAATRGSLLHSIFETFYRSLGGERPSYEKHKETINKLAEEKINALKNIQPPPSMSVYEQETEDLVRCCHIFLKEEEVYSEHYSALHFEYEFGLNEKEPATIALPSGNTIHVRGVVDRIDQSIDGDYHIIDYKTGSSYKYNDSSPFKGGRQLQHFIYSLAIEEHMKLDSKVDGSSYYFPSDKGLGDRYIRKQDQILRTNGSDLLEKLIDVIKSGHFSMTDEKDDCKFCDFKSVCRREFYPEETLEIKQSDDLEGLRKFKGVRAYD